MQEESRQTPPVLAKIAPEQKQVIQKTIPARRAGVYMKLQQQPVEHIPRIYSVTVHEDQADILEEFIDGISLEQLLSQKALSRKEILEIMDGVLDGLQNLHEKGIVHRDLKPEHILLRNGTVWLIDFDASRFYTEDKTKDTEVLGTAGYASPEQYGFEQSDARSDLYSAGKVLEEMDHSGAFRRVIRRATHMDKKQRYGSAREMKKDLHNRLIIFPGLNNPTWLGKGISWICIVLFLAIARPSEQPGFHHTWVYSLAAFLYLYAALWCCMNTSLSENLPYGKYRAVRLLYAFLAWWILIIAGTLVLMAADNLIP